MVCVRRWTAAAADLQMITPAAMPTPDNHLQDYHRHVVDSAKLIRMFLFSTCRDKDESSEASARQIRFVHSAGANDFRNALVQWLTSPHFIPPTQPTTLYSQRYLKKISWALSSHDSCLPPTARPETCPSWLATGTYGMSPIPRDGLF